MLHITTSFCHGTCDEAEIQSNTKSTSRLCWGDRGALTTVCGINNQSHIKRDNCLFMCVLTSTHTYALIWHCVFLVFCLCFVDSHLYKRLERERAGLDPHLPDALYTGSLLLQGYCILIRRSNWKRYNSLFSLLSKEIWQHYTINSAG